MRTDADDGFGLGDDIIDGPSGISVAVTAFCRGAEAAALVGHSRGREEGLAVGILPLDIAAASAIPADARLVLVEVRLMEGFEDLLIVRHVRRLRPLIPIVALSANPSPDFVEEVLAAGATDCVTADVEARVLFPKLARLARLADAARLVEVQNAELVKEMQAQRQAQEERLRAEQERSAALIQAEAMRQTKEILDNLREGFFIVDPSLTIGSVVSAACEGLFGQAIAGRRLGDALGLAKDKEREMVLAFQQLFEDVMPLSLNVSLLPARVATRAGLILDMAYTPVLDARGAPERVIVVAADATRNVLEQERLAAESELHRALFAILRHKDAFEDFVQDFLKDLGFAATTRERGPFLRVLHTLKGNCASFGLGALAKAIHAHEDAVQDTRWEELAGAGTARIAADIEERLMAFLKEHADVLDLREERARDYRVDETAFGMLRALAQDLPLAQRVRLNAVLERVRQAPVESLMTGFAATVERMAERQGKLINYRCTGADVRVDPAVFRPLFNALTHAIRNACDHGIEPPDERKAKGKHPLATIRVDVARPSDEELGIVVSDDGRGIDTDKLLSHAVRMGVVPADAQPRDRKACLGLLFVDGLSTAETVSDTSGRGVGMSCIRDEVRKLGGRIRIATAKDKGTKIILSVPLHGAGLAVAPKVA